MSLETEAPQSTETTDHEIDLDFDSGFGAPTEAAEQPTETPAPAAEEEPAPVNPEPEPETPEPPKLAQLTEDQYQELLTKAGRVDELQSKIDQSFGRFGQKLKDVADRVEGMSQATGKVEITDAMFDGLTDEYPEMGKLVRQTLERFAEGIKPGSAPAASVDLDALAKLKDEAVSLARHQIAEEILDGTHEDWREVVGVPENGAIPDTAFRRWLAEQPEAYRNRVGGTFSPGVIGKAIDAFREHEKAKRAKAGSRKEVIAASVTPRSSGPTPVGRRESDDDDFNAGFRS